MKNVRAEEKKEKMFVCMRWALVSSFMSAREREREIESERKKERESYIAIDAYIVIMKS